MRMKRAAIVDPQTNKWNYGCILKAANMWCIFTYKGLGRSRLIGGRILDALDGGGGREGGLADGLLGGDAEGVGSG